MVVADGGVAATCGQPDAAALAEAYSAGLGTPHHAVYPDRRRWGCFTSCCLLSGNRRLLSHRSGDGCSPERHCEWERAPTTPSLFLCLEIPSRRHHRKPTNDGSPVQAGRRGQPKISFSTTWFIVACFHFFQGGKKGAHWYDSNSQRNVAVVVKPLTVYLHGTRTPAFFRTEELLGLETQ